VLRERRTDSALARTLGASPAEVATLLLSEALWLGVLASVLGLALGQGLCAPASPYKPTMPTGPRTPTTRHVGPVGNPR